MHREWLQPRNIIHGSYEQKVCSGKNAKKKLQSYYAKLAKLIENMGKLQQNLQKLATSKTDKFASIYEARSSAAQAGSFSCLQPFNQIHLSEQRSAAIIFKSLFVYKLCV